MLLAVPVSGRKRCRLVFFQTRGMFFEEYTHIRQPLVHVGCHKELDFASEAEAERTRAQLAWVWL